MQANTKIRMRYIGALVFGLVFLVVVAGLVYWLLIIKEVRNFWALAGVFLFLVLPWFKALFTLPNEFKGMMIVLKSDNPAEDVEMLAMLRERDLL
jgi:hypothetical protein